VTFAQKTKKLGLSVLEESIWVQFKASKIDLPVREHTFAYPRRFRFDFAWPERKLAVECQGGIWRPGGGAHSRPANIVRDNEKSNLAAALGWKVYKFDMNDIKSGRALQIIEDELKK